jgi:hypothetical protein
VEKVYSLMECGKCMNQLSTCSSESTPRTTCAAMCPVSTGLLNKLVDSKTCLAGGVDYNFKCVTLVIHMVQSGRV